MALRGGFGPMGDLPTNLAVPAVAGTPTVGQALSWVPGVWDGFPLPTFTLQWFWADTSAPIAGATAGTYTLVAGDVGHTIKLRVTATNQFGSVAAESVPTAAVGA